MSTAAMLLPVAEASPQLKARSAGVLYLLTIALGALVLSIHGRWGFVLDLIAGSCYIAVPLLFYDMFKPVSRSLSFLAAFFGLMQIKVGELTVRGMDIGMVFHALYCLLIGYLIFKSTFLPRILGGLMVFAGLGWLTALSNLSGYHLVPGILGEGSLTVWLLVMGVNANRWKEQASGAGE